MRLSDADKRKLDGEEGPAVRHAMEHLVKMGEAFEAEEMVDLHSCHLLSDYRTMGEGGLEFYEQLVEWGGIMRVPTTCDPMSMDMKNMDKFDWPEGYPEKQTRISDAFRNLGVALTFSCTPHLGHNVPKFGENLAWVEGNATGYANSVLGARGNQEDSITAPLAGIAGRTPKFGLLDPENRVGECLVEIDPNLMERLGGDGRRAGDFSALGMIIGDFAYDRVPVVTGLRPNLETEELKAMCSACSPALIGTLMFLVGISPEANTVEEAFGGKVSKDVDRLWVDAGTMRQAYEQLSNTTKEDVDVVMSGCPFKTIYEIQEVVEQLGDDKVKEGVKFIIHTDRVTYVLAEHMGLVDRIVDAGALLTTDTCEYCMPIENMYGPDTVIAADSMKMRRLVAGEGKPTWRYGTLTDCVNAAITGKFRPTHWN